MMKNSNKKPIKNEGGARAPGRHGPGYEGFIRLHAAYTKLMDPEECGLRPLRRTPRASLGGGVPTTKVGDGTMTAGGGSAISSNGEGENQQPRPQWSGEGAIALQPPPSAPHLLLSLPISSSLPSRTPDEACRMVRWRAEEPEHLVEATRARAEWGMGTCAYFGVRWRTRTKRGSQRRAKLAMML